jgi:hypothetical protein
VDAARSLNELEPPDWGTAPRDASGLVRAVYAARQKPIEALTIEDLRVLIGQTESLNRLIPIAISKLRENPLCEGDMYPGDLLNAVLGVDPHFWHGHVDLAYEVEEVLQGVEQALERLREPIAQFKAANFARP